MMVVMMMVMVMMMMMMATHEVSSLLASFLSPFAKGLVCLQDEGAGGSTIASRREK